MRKYNIGDKVKVKSWEDMAKEHCIDDDGDIFFEDDELYFMQETMKPLCGTIVEISKFDDYYNGYNIKEMDDHFTWTDEMFEDANPIVKSKSFHIHLYDKNEEIICVDSLEKAIQHAKEFEQLNKTVIISDPEWKIIKQ